MNSNNFSMENVYTLSDMIVYDAESEEVILSIGRVSIAMTTEEFSFVTQEVEKASLGIRKILLSKVQNVDKNQEIN